MFRPGDQQECVGTGPPGQIDVLLMIETLRYLQDPKLWEL